MDLIKMENLNAKLLELLVTIPFPYSDILQRQINASSYKNTFSLDFYCIHFEVKANVDALPSELDVMPLSWQFLIGKAPLQFQLFVKNGYIDSLEIINYAFDKINWDQIWSAVPLLDFEYNAQCIIDCFENKKIDINMMQCTGSRVDMDIDLEDKSFVVCFRGCYVRKLISSLPVKQCEITMRKMVGTQHRFSVSSNDGNIDFECALMFIQWHAKLG